MYSMLWRVFQLNSSNIKLRLAALIYNILNEDKLVSKIKAIK